MAGYIIPTFNLDCLILYPGGGTEANCNLAWGRRVNTMTQTVNNEYSNGFTMLLLLPAGTAITSEQQSGPGQGSIVEVPLGSGRWYAVLYVDDIGKGFPNEHRAAVIQAISPWPGPLYP